MLGPIRTNVRLNSPGEGGVVFCNYVILSLGASRAPSKLPSVCRARPSAGSRACGCSLLWRRMRSAVDMRRPVVGLRGVWEPGSAVLRMQCSVGAGPVHARAQLGAPVPGARRQARPPAVARASPRVTALTRSTGSPKVSAPRPAPLKRGLSPWQVTSSDDVAVALALAADPL